MLTKIAKSMRFALRPCSSLVSTIKSPNPSLCASSSSISSSRRNYASAAGATPRSLLNKTSLQALPDTLEGKVISITGAASGMGLALAKLLAQRGAILSIADVSDDGIQKAKAEVDQLSAQPTTLAQKVDVSQKAEVSDWIEKTVSKFGRLDAAANVAGVYNAVKPEKALFHEEQDDDTRGWQWVFDVNVNGMANCMKSQLKHMKEGAAIVNVSSITGLRAITGTPHAYHASKHAVIGLTRSVALQYGPLGIRMNAVAPGATETAMLSQARNEMKRGDEQEKLVAGSPIPRRADPEEVAKVIMFLLSHDASLVTGSVFSVDGGLCA